jgi:hypothetical protein
MEPENPLDPSSVLTEEHLAALVRRADGPAPSADFVRRTMRAVRRTPLAPGRKRLRDPLASLLGWAALIASVSLSALMVAVTSPIVGSVFTQLVGRSVSIGVWLTHFRGPALALADLLTTIGLAVAKAAATKEGTAGLLLIAVMGVVSLSALHRLLMTEGEDSQWQEIS